MISANNAFTHILVYIRARNGQTEVTMSLNMRAKNSFFFFGEAPYSSTEWSISISYGLLLLPILWSCI